MQQNDHLPSPGQVFDRDSFREKANLLRTPEGLPSWCYDFISLHQSDGVWTLMSPPSLIKESGRRPTVESIKFEDKAVALLKARELALSVITRPIFIVVCNA